jgi:hypothetical protein
VQLKALAQLAAVAGVIAASSVVAVASAGTGVKDPSGIQCPPAPAGWKLSAVEGKTIWDGAHNARLAGLQQIAVNCNYVTDEFRHIEVTVAYALPTDINPRGDFFFGCSSGVTPWNATDRTFYVMSGTQWAMATFNDFLDQLDESEARAFQQVTRKLLGNADGYAHDCQLALKPTVATTRYTFSFETPGASGGGSFSTRGQADPATNVMHIVGVKAPNIPIGVSGTKKALLVAVKGGVDYRPPTPTSTAKLRLAVVVISSKLPSCRRGAPGTLTVTTAPQVRLTVCGRSFLQGKATASILQL